MQTDVLVAGAGPVGLMMAAELARYGVKARVIDKGAHRSETSKALVLWSRSLEMLDRMGCGARFVAAGHKVLAANMFAGGKRLAHVPLDAGATPHPYALMLPQSETERLLEEHLGSLGVPVERQVELLRFSAGADDVQASLRHADGREETVRVGWLLGCDGAHSAVRHGVGVAFEGKTLPSGWILADVHLAGMPTAATEMDVYFQDEGVLVTFPITPGRYRMIADVSDRAEGDIPEEPSLAEVQALLDRRGPGGVTASDPVWLSGFRINERKVAAYRAGRVFLAGDAAHVHSPAGGQGMNTGLQDACNLAWKLALVVRGRAPADGILLDSYGTERGPVARQVLRDTGRLTMLGVLRGAVLQEVRNLALSLLLGLHPAQQAMADKLAELDIAYPDSPLSQRGHRGRGGPAAGQRAPVTGGETPAPVGDGPRFALHATPGEAATALIARHPVLLEPHVRAPLGEGGLWLVRPDGYVAATAAADDWDALGLYLDRLAAA